MGIDRSECMLRYVEPYYKESRFYTAQNNAKGQEFNIIQAIIEDLPNQFNPQTATWGLRLWEELFNIDSMGDFEERRIRILSKMATLSYITPITLERLMENVFGVNINIIRNIAPYTFLIKFDYADKYLNAKAIRQLIEDYKEAHMAYNLLAYYDIKLNVNIKIENSLDIKHAVYPRFNIPYLYYDGTIYFDEGYYFHGYKITKNIVFFPTRLTVKMDSKPLFFYRMALGIRNSSMQQASIKQLWRLKSGSRIPSKKETRLTIPSQTRRLPDYQTTVTIYYHITKYNGQYTYDGTRSYDSKIIKESL